MNRTQVAWFFGRPFFRGLVKVFAPLRVYGTERIPRNGPVVFCFNHFSWLDPWVLGSVAGRTLYYVTKQEAWSTPVMGHFIRIFGTLPVKRGASDREAIRLMKQVVRDGAALGMFVEGTRQAREPGPAKPGAAMIAIQERVPVICAAIHGTQEWQFGNFKPVSVAYGEPFLLDRFARNSQGYRAASLEIERELRRLYDFLVQTHELGRPRVAIPPP